ncbi:MAG: beta-1 4-xylanase [Comamonadaceae bacterium]|nr:MAG: beta-1 4-xylanase [Comamonadaceae bacterium]
MNRREWLGSAALACVGWHGAAQAQTPGGLDALARTSGRRFGFAVSPGYADKQPVKELLKQHAGVITAENAMKWRHIENMFGMPDYTQADRVAEMADGLKAQLRGHTLALSRYQGRIHTWDVLNEVIDADQPTGMRESVLSRLWGVDRYPALFELARAADPHAKLAYNDYGMEQDEPWCEQRRSAVLRMLERWVQRGTLIDTMGVQAHLNVSRKFSASKLLRFFDELRALGLSIQVTELDVSDAQWQGDVASRDAAIAALYRDFTQACLSHPAVEMIVMWNVTDADSWLNRWSQGQRRADGQAQRPMLFDAQGQAKPAFHAVTACLADTSIHFDRKETRHV